MSDRAADNNHSTAESVSPRVIIIAATVVGVLVLIIMGWAVFAIIRAHKRRQRRRGQRLSGADEEAGLSSESVWREGNWDNHVRNGRLTRESRQMKGTAATDRRGAVIGSPEPTATRSSYRQAPSWDARDLVGQGSRRGPLTATNGTANADRGYGIGLATGLYEASGGNSVHTAEIALGMAPAMHTNEHQSASKIERMTGNPLSNDLYEDRKSGRGSPRDSRALETNGGPSYPQLNTNIPQIPLDVAIDTDISPSTTIWSRDFDFSPSCAGGEGSPGTQLAPPPPAYPNIATLARANPTVCPEQFPTSSYSPPTKDQSIVEHIAAQFDSSLTGTGGRGRSGAGHTRITVLSRSSSTQNLAPPLSAAFGGFTGLTRHGSKGSHISRRSSSASPHRLGKLTGGADDAPMSSHLATRLRRSWNGRSVLLLDEFPGRRASPAPSPSLSRVSGFGCDGGGGGGNSDCLGSPSPQEGTEPARRQQEDELQWIASSKISIASMPSSVASFTSTMYNNASGGGLSPAPAPRQIRANSPVDGTVAGSPSHRAAVELELEARTRDWARERAEAQHQEQRMMRRRREQGEDDEYHARPARASFGFL